MNVYNLQDIPSESPRPGLVRRGFRGDNVLLVWNELQPGMQLRPHKHPFEQVACILSGRCRFHVGDQTFEAGPGSVFRIPPDVMHYGEPIGNEVCVNLDVFSPPREDYLHMVEYQKDERG